MRSEQRRKGSSRLNGRSVLRMLSLCALLVVAIHGRAQHRPLDVPDPTHSDAPPTRTRLIMKDGSYQVVLSYKVDGKVVRYRSAERNGASEEIPLSLVDLPATEKWAHDHDPLKRQEDAARPRALSPELPKEEAQHGARTAPRGPG